jgi:hypothetical protein
MGQRHASDGAQRAPRLSFKPDVRSLNRRRLVLRTHYFPFFSFLKATYLTITRGQRPLVTFRTFTSSSYLRESL